MDPELADRLRAIADLADRNAPDLQILSGAIATSAVSVDQRARAEAHGEAFEALARIAGRSGSIAGVARVLLERLEADAGAGARSAGR